MTWLTRTFCKTRKWVQRANARWQCDVSQLESIRDLRRVLGWTLWSSLMIDWILHVQINVKRPSKRGACIQAWLLICASHFQLVLFSIVFYCASSISCPSVGWILIPFTENLGHFIRVKVTWHNVVFLLIGFPNLKANFQLFLDGLEDFFQYQLRLETRV